MITPCFQHAAKRFASMVLMMLAILLSGCMGDDAPDWHGTDISGVMPKLEFNLTDSRGTPVSGDDYSGRVRMLFFGFTSCPDVCPTALQKLSQAVSGLSPENQEEVLTLFVSVDPQRDTPERLAEYVNFFGDKIVGLTGNVSDLRTLTQRYRTTFGHEEPDAEGDYAVTHSGVVYVFDREGNPRLLIRPEDLSAQAIRQDLVALLEEDS
ncbi:MAG: electron transport protein SCO1/SenC [Marinobacter sp. T13-3]|nr:MAG: electron transport protein SCO1/SenC [Marinobacter sp. T13-3]